MLEARSRTTHGERHDSEELAQCILESSADRIEVLDGEGRLVLMNRAGQQAMALGDDPSMLRGRPWEDLWAGSSRKALRAALQAARAGEPARFEGRAISAVDRPTWWQVEVTPLRDREGQTTRFLARAQTIADRTEHERVSRADDDRLQLALAAASLGIWSWDLRSGTLVLSDLCLALLGLPPKTPMTYEGLLASVHPDDREGLDREVRNAVRGGGAFECECRCVWPDGSVHWIGSRGRAYADHAGRPLRLEGVALDVTQRRQEEEARKAAEARLAEREAQLALAIEHCPAPIAIFDRHMHYVAVSRRWRADFHIPEDYVGRDHYKLIPGVPQRWRDIHQRCLAGAVERCEEDVFERPDGQVEWLRWEIHPWRTAAGDVGGVVIFAEMITERKRAEEKLRRAEERFRHLAEAMPHLIWQISGEGQLLYANRQWVEYFGRSSLDRFEWPDVIHGDDLAQISWNFEEMTRHACTFKPVRLRRHDGHYQWFTTRSVPVRDAQGKLLHIVGTSSDVTQHMRLEDELRQAQKMEAIGRLAGGVAHDFNNLLTVILGQASMVQRCPVPERVHAAVREIQSAADRAASLTEQLLAFGRRQVLQPRDLALDEVVRSVSRMLERLLGENITLQIEAASGSPHVYGDPNMLAQVLLNLALNARDAMSLGGQLVIRTSSETLSEQTAQARPEARAGKWACLTVSDTGAGIPPEALPRIFEPFFTTKDVGKGTGLGLATVYGIVQQHRGFIQVDSTLGRGTTFKAFLPLGICADAPLASTESEAPPHGGGERILLVEDEPGVRAIASCVLSQYGYELVVAENGVRALAAFAEQSGRIDLLLTDVIMPEGLCGDELASRLQAEKPGLRTVLCSGYSADRVRDGVRAQPHVEFLQKPYRPEQLLRVVRRLLDAP